MPTKKVAKKTAAQVVPAANSKYYRILSFDGGGIRGLLSAVWMEELEAKLGGSIADHFDLIAGTSTGSIMAAGLSMRVPAKRLKYLYLDHAQTIFPGRAARAWNRLSRLFSDGVSAPKYDGNGLEQVLRAVFGKTTLGELSINPTVLTTYNTLTRSAMVIKNNFSDYRSLRVWEVVKASCSAPTFFPATVVNINGAKCPLIDGGVVANNPTACAVAEGIAVSKQTQRQLNEFMVVSVGTGQTTRAISVEEAQEWGAIEWALPVIDVLMDGALDAVSYIASQLLEDKQYFRFQVPLDEAYDDMDNADQTNLNALMNLAQSCPARGDIDTIVSLVKAEK